MAEHRGVIYQTNQKQALYNISYSFGVLDPLRKELQLIGSGLGINMLEKGVHHKGGLSRTFLFRV
jgi:hypothetical protein